MKKATFALLGLTSTGKADQFDQTSTSCVDTDCGTQEQSYITWNQSGCCGTITYASGDSVYWEQHLSYKGFISVDDAYSYLQLNYYDYYCNTSNSCSTTPFYWIVLSQSSDGTANQTYTSSGTDYKLSLSDPAAGKYGLYVGEYAEVYISLPAGGSGGGSVNFYPSSYETTSYMTLQSYDIYA
jgi:hypothetical protein